MDTQGTTNTQTSEHVIFSLLWPCCDLIMHVLLTQEIEDVDTAAGCSPHATGTVQMSIVTPL
jgi:hypothetical protein